MREYPWSLSLSHWMVVVTLVMRTLQQHLALAQRLPTRDEHNFHWQINRAEIFYDTKVLPDGAQVSCYLLQGAESRYFFLVEENNTPFSITVSPCSSDLEWYITYKEMPPEGSAEGMPSDDEDELFQQQSSESELDGMIILQNFTADTTSSYLNENSPAGIYSIVLTAKDSDSSVQIHATTTPFSDQPYPLLPSDHSVKVMSSTPSTVTLAWKPSPSQSTLHQDVEYCVSVNELQNFGTHCAAETFIFGETPPTPPPHAGFGFSWEEEKQANFQRQARPKPAADPNKAFYFCIGPKTMFTFVNALPGHQYFFDVFVVNKNNNMSNAYTGTNVTTRRQSREIALKDGKVHLAFLKKTRAERTFTYELKHPADELIFVVQPCSGKLVFELSNDSGLIESSKVKEFTQIQISHPGVGNYYLKVASDKTRTQSFRVLVSNDASKNPYPELPEDNQIRVLDNQQSCNSITLAWSGTARRQHYCLYMHQYGKSLVKKRHKDQLACSGPQTRKKADKVLCRNFRARNRRRTMLKETVKGLSADTTYMFDVYVQKPGGQSLNYQRVWASTSPSC